jgi:sporulation protein YlmC with PRC-barrel domain
MKAKELIGKEVIDAKAKRVGKVSDLDIDITKGIVLHVDVKAGLTKTHAINLDMIQVVGDKVILKVNEEVL